MVRAQKRCSLTVASLKLVSLDRRMYLKPLLCWLGTFILQVLWRPLLESPTAGSLTVLLKDTCTSTSKWPLKHLLVLETCTSPPLSIISLAAAHAWPLALIFQASSGCSSVVFPKQTMFLRGLFESFFASL